MPLSKPSESESIPPDSRACLKNALRHHLAGRLDQAWALYGQVLEVAPNDADALHLRGLVAHQRGRHTEAIAMIGRAIRCDPHQPPFHNNLGNAFNALGDTDQAIRCYEAALNLNSGYAEAAINLAKAWYCMGEIDKTRSLVSSILKMDTRDPMVLLEAGLFFQGINLCEPAIEVVEYALALAPENADILCLLAELYQATGKFDQALDTYNAAISVDGGSPQVHNNIGVLLRAQGRQEQAVFHYRQAVGKKPDFEQALYNLGNALRDSGTADEAIACYRQTLRIKPDHSSAHHNLATLLAEQGRVDEAINSYAQALKLDPGLSDAGNQLCYLLRQICDWERLPHYEKLLEQKDREAISKGQTAVSSPFLHLARYDDPSYNFQVAKSHSDRINRQRSMSPYHHQRSLGRQPSRIRIGYISNNFRDHPTAHLLHDLFRLHDRDRFEVYGYSMGPDDGSRYREEIKNGCDVFRDVRELDDRTLARRVNGDRIDIYVDLMGQTTGSRMGVAALRPAPLQVRYLGMAGTTGADFFDYLITDRIVTPPDQAPYYSEKFAYLPHSYQINSRKFVDTTQVWSREDVGLAPAASFVFCSFNTSYKLDPVMFGTWMKVLQQVPGSVLWLLGGLHSLENNLRQAAQAHGVAPERMVFASKLTKERHLARLGLADMILDTRLINGAASTSDALWMGVPVLTLQGAHFASRMSASLLQAVGLPSLINYDLQAYKTLAVRLATDAALFKKIRRQLARNRSGAPLFDTALSVRLLETAYKKMWHRFIRGMAPDQIEAGAY